MGVHAGRRAGLAAVECAEALEAERRDRPCDLRAYAVPRRHQGREEAFAENRCQPLATGQELGCHRIEVAMRAQLDFPLTIRRVVAVGKAVLQDDDRRIGPVEPFGERRFRAIRNNRKRQRHIMALRQGDQPFQGRGDGHRVVVAPPERRLAPQFRPSVQLRRQSNPTGRPRAIAGGGPRQWGRAEVSHRRLSDFRTIINRSMRSRTRGLAGITCI